MTEKTALWDKLGKTDPAHTKEFSRAGGFKGTAIKPMFSYRRMTEEFGPCGIGWGIGEPAFQVVPAGDEILVYCTVSVWHEKPEQRVFGVGGDKVAGKNKYGVSTDDEAFKKAFTDAVTNALKLIGVGADVHMGMFDDNKYVNTMRQEFSGEGKEAAPAPKQQNKPISSAENKRQLEVISSELIDARSPGEVVKLMNIWADTAEKEGWSNDYWDEARRRFARRKKELEEDDGRITDVSGRELSNAEAA
ncbi:hypothetical protein LPB79_13025 [Rhizobium sp. T136]|uniref:hypothetical protein n=1 Tax=Rhizobium sp. T136 TaxID=555319 RepID=UPI001E56C11D|nr:hypothetical protein [Rhizobium sp. T136]UFS83169.1 hypothetical protein LPB79_13025 [Rhizobium sp. T136]